MGLFTKVYALDYEQFLPVGIEEAWDFFSSPHNLKKITPPHMGFEITNDIGSGKMYAGMIITYIVKPILRIPIRWCTIITHVEEGKYFIDEQRFGPYALWHHQHRFEPVDGGVMMYDTVSYALPLGPLGRLANALFVRKEVKGIFAYRQKVTDDVFGTK